MQAAYRDADQRLEAKILQIDPSLQPYVKERQSVKPPVKTVKATAAAPKPKPEVKAKKAAESKATHVVVAGDTLGSIAKKNRVTVLALKTANNIEDDRKLPVGQVLTIPGAKENEQKPEDGFWSKVKKHF